MEMIPAMLTLFRTDGALDLAATRTYARFLCDRGATQLLVLGSNGSFPLLDPSERQAVVEAVIEAVGDRIPVLVQVGDPATQRAVNLTRSAKQDGAAGIVAVTPILLRIR
ncbi:MAG: dihydrodipicolinate synthase family protein [Firmicutes bacterium]|nr:dihydrodipicolinate synthase family protein [Bacillota bacterium]